MRAKGEFYYLDQYFQIVFHVQQFLDRSSIKIDIPIFHVERPVQILIMLHNK